MMRTCVASELDALTNGPLTAPMDPPFSDERAHSKYYAPVGGHRVRLDKAKSGRCCVMSCALGALLPILIGVGFLFAPEPFSSVVTTRTGQKWNNFEAVLPSPDTSFEIFNQRFKLKAKIENSKYEVEGLDAEVEMDITVSGRSSGDEDWTELFSSTRTRTLECYKGKKECNPIVLLYDAAPFFQQYKIKVNIAKDRAHAYGFIQSADYVFEYCSPHWTFYEAALKFVFLVVAIWSLYDFYDRITCGSPFSLCVPCGGAGEAAPSIALIQPEQRFIGLLLVGLICLNDWPLFIYLFTGGWGVAVLSDIMESSFAFMLLLILACMTVETQRSERTQFGSQRRFAVLVVFIGALWALHVMWLVYTRAKRFENSSYSPIVDDRTLFLTFRTVVLAGSAIVLFVSIVAGCYEAGAADGKAVVYSQVGDKNWKEDRKRRSSFFWGVTSVWAFCAGFPCLWWSLSREIELPWEDTLADHSHGITLTSLLVITNVYVLILMDAFTPARVPAQDEDMVAYLNKFHL